MVKNRNERRYIYISTITCMIFNMFHYYSLSWHCEEECTFDLCFGCTRSHKSLVHPHRLVKAKPRLLYPQQTGWKCDACQTIFMHDDQEKPYDCKECSFDLCFVCLKSKIPHKLHELLFSILFQSYYRRNLN